jgi:hypothetical protein
MTPGDYLVVCVDGHRFYERVGQGGWRFADCPICEAPRHGVLLLPPPEPEPEGHA